jgi:hypothetical protein
MRSRWRTKETIVEKIWLEQYPEGVPPMVDTSEYDSLIHLFEDSCRRYANKVAYVSLGKEMTYAELDRQSRAFAGWLQSQGLGKGDAVALMMPNLLQYPVCLFGILRAGCVMVNCNPLYKPRELEYQLVDSQAKAIVIAENFAHVLDKIKNRQHLKHVVVTAVGDLLGGMKRLLVNFVVGGSRKACQCGPCRGTCGCATRWPVVPASVSTRQRWARPTWPSCNTPAAPPAWPRVRCCRTATWWRMSARRMPGFVRRCAKARNAS